MCNFKYYNQFSSFNSTHSKWYFSELVHFRVVHLGSPWTGQPHTCQPPEYDKLSGDIYNFRLKIAEDFRRSSKISDEVRRLPKISRRLPKITEGVEGFLTTSKPDSPTVFRRKKIEFLFNWFLSNYTHYCQLDVGNLSECVRSIKAQFE